VDGSFRLFQLQAVPIPEHYTPRSAVGSQAIVTREFLAVAEVPAWWAYGPFGRNVLGLIYAVGSLKREELDAVGRRIDSAGLEFARVKFDALAAADKVIAESGRTGAARLARGYARAATYGTWDRDSALGHAASLAGDIAHVMSVGDLISENLLNSLTNWLKPQIQELLPVGDGAAYGTVVQPEGADAEADA